MSEHFAAVRKHWWIVVLALAVSIGLAVLVTVRAVPQYASTVTFYVSATSDTGTALQADEFAQRRINSYVGVLSSDRMAELLVANHPLGLNAQQVASRISAVAGNDTILLTATVVDDRPDRSLAIARAIAAEFGPLVSELDNTGGASSAKVSLEVISGPTLNPDPVSPRKSLNLGVGVLFGLALGIALAIAREAADRTIRSTDVLKAVTRLPALGSITIERGGRKSGSVTADPRTRRFEAYRQLRTNLTFSAVGKQMKVVLVTSAMPGEGKSTTAVNLALAIAETGRPVLLIDADLRRPCIADYLGLEGAVGLTNVLAGQADVDDVLQPVGTGSLQILAAGTIPPNPSELLGSDRMHDLLGQLRQRFDMVVIDTAPVVPVTDAAVASAHVDGVVLVVRYARTSREQVRAAVEMLTTVEAPLSGAALNMVPEQSGSSGYGYAPLQETGSGGGSIGGSAGGSGGGSASHPAPPPTAGLADSRVHDLAVAALAVGRRALGLTDAGRRTWSTARAAVSQRSTT